MALNQTVGSVAAGAAARPGSPPLEPGTRNAKGEWQPSYPVKYAPLFEWPPRPAAVLKWLLSYPGFLWPWNSVYLLLTLASWFFLQPALSSCAHFRADWIGLMFLRNLGLLWLISGGWPTYGR